MGFNVVLWSICMRFYGLFSGVEVTTLLSHHFRNWNIPSSNCHRLSMKSNVQTKIDWISREVLMDLTYGAECCTAMYTT